MQINFKQAYKITSANRYRIFAKSDKTAGKSGYERICREFADINHSPKFSLSSNDKVFTIGSCFARNIELWLARKGIKSITSDCIIPGELYEATGLGARNGALNAYTPSSMQELVKLGQADNIELGTLKTGDDEFYDMMVSGLRPLNFEELTLVRDKVCSTYRRIGEAKTIIITLGYTESWFDTEQNIYVNRSPGATIKTVRRGGRYNFHNLTYNEILRCLESITNTIKDLCSENVKIVITVSPVPLHATFTEMDVVRANLLSKSRLLNAAQDFCGQYDFVDYYPSYEMVTYSDPKISWKADGVHVKSDVVGQVINKFQELYYTE